MIFNKIISQYDRHNEEMLFLIDKFKVDTVVFIIVKSQVNEVKELKESYKKMFNCKKIILEVVQENDVSTIFSVVKKNKDSIINLSGGNRIIALILLKVATQLKVQSIYIDFINKTRFVFRDKCVVINNSLKDITLEEIFSLSGADIVNESTYLCEKNEVMEISKKILNNLSLWHQYKQQLYNNNIFKHDYKDPLNVEIKLESLNKNELNLLKKSIEYLRQRKLIELTNKENVELITFKNDYLKGFLFKSGTWLEVITYLAINRIKEVDEVKCGVLFSWGRKAKAVKNEIDVVAVKDSILICVSCKDSNKYDEEALNELSIYTERLGGKSAVKILVASKKPEKKTVLERAKEMNINVVVLENDTLEILEKLLNEIINRNIK